MNRCKRCYYDEYITEKELGSFSLGRLGGCEIAIDAKKKTLQVILLNNYDMEILYETKIKYCPICGKKLGSEDKVQPMSKEVQEHYEKLASYYNGGAHESIQDTDDGK